MAFGLTMGTERATALQNAIQDELMKRQYSMEPGTYPSRLDRSVMADLSHLIQDPVMAEYITIMVINNKTAGPSHSVSHFSRDKSAHHTSPAQITSELEDREHLLLVSFITY